MNTKKTHFWIHGYWTCRFCAARKRSVCCWQQDWPCKIQRNWKNGSQKREQIVHEHIGVFRTTFSSCSPAAVPPVRIDRTPEARPVRVRLRSYSQELRESLSIFAEIVVWCDLAYSNPTSACACALLLVPKPGPNNFRFTVHFCAVNKLTVRHQFHVPHLGHVLTKLAKSKVYATFDPCHEKLQLSLDRFPQSFQSFINTEGFYTLTHLMHVMMNAVTHLQSIYGTIVPETLLKYLL